MPLYPRTPFLLVAVFLALFPLIAARAAEESAPHINHAAPPEQAKATAPHAGPGMSAMPGMNATDPHAGHTAPTAQPSESSGAPASTPLVINPPQPATFPLKQQGTPPPEIVERLGDHVPPGITLVDEHGKSVDVRELLDRPTLIMPVFFSCPAGCHTMQASMAAALPGVNLEPGRDFRVISVSFDEEDTPAQALRKKADYMAAMNFAFPEDAWIFLTGDQDSIKRFMDALGFPFIRIGKGNFSHPLAVIVTAPEGKVVRYMYGQGFLPFDLNMALNEAALGKTGLSVKRMLAYCFSYDPEARGYVFNFMRVAGAFIIFGALVFLAILLLGGKKKRRASS